MIQSIRFGDEFVNGVLTGKGTWDDWHLLPTERPVFQPPAPKTLYLDIPGGNGSLDLSESLTRYPIYNNRTGSFTFRVMNGYKPWQERYEEILNYLHGRAMRAILYDDPDWFYQGRFSIDGWNAGDTWSQIVIGYNLNPFKWSIVSSSEPWIWDPFNFETGIIWEDTFSNITISGASWSGIWAQQNFMADFFGKVPISPTFIVSGTPELSGIDVRFVNTFLGIDVTLNLKNGTTFVPDFIFFGQTSDYKMYFQRKSAATVTISIDFRVGRL